MFLGKSKLVKHARMQEKSNFFNLAVEALKLFKRGPKQPTQRHQSSELPRVRSPPKEQYFLFKQ